MPLPVPETCARPISRVQRQPADRTARHSAPGRPEANSAEIRRNHLRLVRGRSEENEAERSLVARIARQFHHRFRQDRQAAATATV